jgi:hypothetical protein
MLSIMKYIFPIFDLFLFALHVGYIYIKLELLRQILIITPIFGFWRNCVMFVMFCGSLYILDIIFDIFSQHGVAYHIIKSVYKNIVSLNRLDNDILNIVNSNRYTRSINKLIDRFKIWLCGIVVWFVILMVRDYNDGIREILGAEFADQLLFFNRSIFNSGDTTQIRQLFNDTIVRTYTNLINSNNTVQIVDESSNDIMRMYLNLINGTNNNIQNFDGLPNDFIQAYANLTNNTNNLINTSNNIIDTTNNIIQNIGHTSDIDDINHDSDNDNDSDIDDIIPNTANHLNDSHLNDGTPQEIHENY